MGPENSSPQLTRQAVFHGLRCPKRRIAINDLKSHTAQCCEGHKVPQSLKPQKIQSNEKVTLKSYFLSTFLFIFRYFRVDPPKSLFRYFFVTLNFPGFQALWDLLPLTSPVKSQLASKSVRISVGISTDIATIRSTMISNHLVSPASRKSA